MCTVFEETRREGIAEKELLRLDMNLGFQKKRFLQDYRKS